MHPGPDIDSPAVSIIAGGPSLSQTRFKDLPPFFRIGVNRSAWLADCDALVTMDGRFERSFEREVCNFRGMTLSSARPVTLTRNVLRCNPGPRSGMSRAFPTLHGNNSGHAAVNAALLLGFKRIYLLGFDFTTTERSHWHEGYRWEEPAMASRYARWAADLDACAPGIAARGHTVVNVLGMSPSRLTAYPVMSLEDFYRLDS
jgi:hypothetical protein